MKLAAALPDVDNRNGYNSLENPIGIETARKQYQECSPPTRYNSLENPIGIETIKTIEQIDKSKSYNSLENPIGIETLHDPRRRRLALGYNSLENPIGLKRRMGRSSAQVIPVTTH